MINRFHKLIVFAISLCLILCSTVAFFSVSAENETTAITPEAGNGGTSISVTTVIITAPSFSVSIPTGIPVGEISRTEESDIVKKPFTLGVSGVESGELDGQEIRVTVADPMQAGVPTSVFYMYNGQHKLPYALYNGTTKIANESVFHTFTADETVTGYVEVDQKDIPATGSYTGTLTFTVSLVDAE